MIRYLPYDNIDLTAWDKCVALSSNGRIYASSAYLNALAKRWDGLVLNNYEAVMPLTYDVKWGQHYLYQPAFSAQLGIFSAAATLALTNAFLKAIPVKFKFWDIAICNTEPIQLANSATATRQNFVLALNDYEQIFSSYRESIRRNIKKAKQLCNIKKDVALAEIIDLSRNYTTGYSALKSSDYIGFEHIYQMLKHQQKAITYGVYLNDELVAGAAFVIDQKRAYYILVGHHPNSKTCGASHALINAFIQEHCNIGLMLDFEGSDIASLAFFYESFGATKEYYQQIKYNNLPFWMKWLKK